MNAQLRIRLLSPHIGAAVDHTPEEILASPALSHAVAGALDTHQMLWLHAPDADPMVVAQFCALFGTVRQGGNRCAGGVSGLRIVANEEDAQGRPVPGGDSMGQVWHTDSAAETKPPARIVTYTERAAASRPTTAWINMLKVYEALPETLKKEIASLSAVHYPLKNAVREDTQSLTVPVEQRRQGPLRPLACRNPAAGAGEASTYLYLPCRHDSLIPGLQEAESRRLLDTLWQFVEASPFRHTAAPESGSCVVMENRTVVHNRQGWPNNDPRTIWSIGCEGALPVAAAGLQ